MDAAFEKVRALKVQFVSTAPQTLPPPIPAAAGVKAFYFRDPDGHNLELIYFPLGKGDPRWQQPNDKIFLGIDHTAIGIASTAATRRDPFQDSRRCRRPAGGGRTRLPTHLDGRTRQRP